LTVSTGPGPPPAGRRTLVEEVLVVLALSLLASAVFAIIDLVSAPLKGVTVVSVDQSVELAKQIAGIVFGLAPVWLVVHLVRRSGEGTGAIGLAWDDPGPDVARGVALFVVVGLAGLGLYLGSVAIGVNRFVVPVPPLHHWWTVPVLLLDAVAAALLEEIIVLGYLITRLRQLTLTPAAAIGVSALLRGAYHLYQGWGAFLGNVVMGALFGALFVRWKRTWPFVIAHALLDAVAGIGYILFRKHLPGVA
jgi:membrane protease YdiL (CAAX protease family)